MRLVIVAAPIAPEDLSNCDMARGLFGVQRAECKVQSARAVAPEKVAKSIVAKGVAKNYDYALEAIKSLPYGRWREYDAEDTVRFWSLRLHEAGMIKSSPQKILAQGTDWRFLREIKKELKA